jgi:ribose-phosphate pyrophosphokinase
MVGAIALFALNASREFAERVAHALGIPLDAHEEREFEDGEHKTRPLRSVRGCNVFVVQSLYSDAHQSVNDKLVRLLLFLGALEDASAGSVTAVIPYLAYARKDAKTQPRDPVTTRYVAQLFEAVGVERVLTLDVHNLAAFQNAFRCRTDHLNATRLFVDYFAPLFRGEDRVVVVSPDPGGAKRAERFRRALERRRQGEIGLGFLEKARGKGVLSLGRLIGDVADSHVIVLDDLISTGSTLRHAARTCKNQGAKSVYAAATHGVFAGAANGLLEAAEIEKVVVTDSVAPWRLDPELMKNKLVVLSVAGLFAEAIRRIHEGGSLVALLDV